MAAEIAYATDGPQDNSRPELYVLIRNADYQA